MKQAARIQRQMEAVQAQLAARTVEATSGGGAVKVVARCDGTIASIKIDPQAINANDAQLPKPGQGDFHRGNGQSNVRFQPARSDVTRRVNALKR